MYFVPKFVKLKFVVFNSPTTFTSIIGEFMLPTVARKFVVPTELPKSSPNSSIDTSVLSPTA